MTLFLVVAGLLLAGIVIGLLYPLLRASGQTDGAAAKVRELNLAVLREQRAELEKDYAEGVLDAAAYEKAREELERRTLEDAAALAQPAPSAMRRPMVAGGLAVLVPAVVIGLYVLLGEPGAMTGETAAGKGEAGAHAVSPQQILARVESLANRLQENPNDGEGWLMLARSYAVLGRFAESVAAYNRALPLLPPDAQLLADFADTVAMAQGRKLQGEPEKIVRRALEIDPKNIKALALSGTIAFDRQDYQAAIGEWRRILALVPEDSGVAAGIQGSIRDAENRLALAGSNGGGGEVKATVGGVSGVVSIDPKIAAGASPSDAVFVFARAVEGPKMPLAIMRKTVADLPIKFALDDSMAMAPNLRLSQFSQVVVGARVSKSGDALPRSGDLEGLSKPVSPGATGVKIQISQTVK